MLPRLGARTVVLYNGVAGPREVVPPRMELEPPVRLLYIGRLSERKGVQDAVDAVACLMERGVEACLDVVGGTFSGNEWLEQDLRTRSRDAGTADRVQLHGFDPVVWPHLQRADVLIVPSRLDEPFGNTAVEGALAARPIVVSKTSGLLEASQDLGAAVGIPPGDAGAIADAVMEIIGGWDTLRLAALADAERASVRFSPATYRTSMADLVADLLP